MAPSHPPKNPWSALLLALGLAGLLVFVAFMIYWDAAQQDKIARNSPRVWMKVIGRKKGVGTLKYPDHIYAHYQGENYDFACGRKYFRKTRAADRIVAHVDVSRKQAALPGSGRVRHLAFLLALILGVAILAGYQGVRQFINARQAHSKQRANRLDATGG